MFSNVDSWSARSIAGSWCVKDGCRDRAEVEVDDEAWLVGDRGCRPLVLRFAGRRGGVVGTDISVQREQPL